MIISSIRTRQNNSQLRLDGGCSHGCLPEYASPVSTPNARLGAEDASELEISTEHIENALDPSPDRERIRMLLVGSPLGVTRTIQTLDRLSFVELHRWSQLTGAPERLHLDPRPGEVLSILTRYWLRRS